MPTLIEQSIKNDRKDFIKTLYKKTSVRIGIELLLIYSFTMHITSLYKCIVACANCSVYIRTRRSNYISREFQSVLQYLTIILNISTKQPSFHSLSILIHALSCKPHFFICALKNHLKSSFIVSFSYKLDV